MFSPKDFIAAIEVTTIPAGLIAIPSREIVALTPAAQKISQRFGDEGLAGSKVAVTSEAWELMMTGHMDGYESSRQVPGSDEIITFWARGVGVGRPWPYLLVVVNHERGEPKVQPGLRRLDGAPVIGAFDQLLTIDRVTSNVDALGYKPQDLVGTSLLALAHTADVAHVLAAIAQCFVTNRPVGVDVRVRTGDGIWADEQMVVMSTVGAAWSCAFVLMDREQKPSGVLDIVRDPSSKAIYDPSRLSPREAEVLNLFAKGKTAVGISQALFISQSTARNHLSSIFKKFQVTSQAELLRLVGARRRIGDQ